MGKPETKYLITLFLITCFFRLTAQEHLDLYYHPFKAKDTSYVNALIRRGFFLITRDADSAGMIFSEAVQKSREIGFEDGIGHALTFMGVAATSRGHYQEGFAFYREALPFCLKAKYNKTALPVLFINMAFSYFQAGEYAMAGYYNYKALAYLQEHLPEDGNIIMVYINLSTIQSKLGKHKQALNYALYARKLAVDKGIPIALGGALVNIGMEYTFLNQPDSALCFLLETYKLAREEDFTDLQQVSLTGLGDLMQKEGKNEQAINYYRQSIRLSQATNPLYGSILPGYSLGASLFRLKRYKEAEQILMEAIAKAEKTGLTENKQEAHLTLACIYEATGKYKMALQQQRIYQHLNDSATNIAKIRAINELAVKYQVTQKDKEIIQKELRITQQDKKLSRKNIIIACITGGIILFVISGFIFYRYRRKISNRDAEIKLLKAMVTGEEKERARISRELHDGLGGMLTGIKMNLRALQRQDDKSCLPQKLDSIMYMLLDMDTEIHKTARNLMPDILLKHSLPEALKVYCGQLNNTGLQLSLQFYGNMQGLDKSMELALYRILQELIQNIIKHAQASQGAIQIRREGETLYISVEDNGKGFEGKSGKGLGLQNLEARVKLLGGYFALSSVTGKGTTIFIEIHLKNKTTK